MSYSTLSSICEESESTGIPFWQLIERDDCRERQVSEDEVFETMRGMYHAMKAADRSYDPELRSASGMTGGEGAKIEAYRKSGHALLGDFLSEVIEKAVKMAESNACMHRIVAAPTAGSCGVIPAVLLAYEDFRGAEEDEIIKSLFVAAGIGEVLAETACIAGAQGGCQAEIGSAAAMAAGAVAFLEGGDNETVIHAAALAIKDLLGLTCDPVAGLVEVPCVKRNAAGAAVAMTAAELALAGVRSQIPPDEVVEAMDAVGSQIPACLRETAEGGLAVTPTAKRIQERLNQQSDME